MEVDWLPRTAKQHTCPLLVQALEYKMGLNELQTPFRAAITEQNFDEASQPWEILADRVSSGAYRPLEEDKMRTNVNWRACRGRGWETNRPLVEGLAGELGISKPDDVPDQCIRGCEHHLDLPRPERRGRRSSFGRRTGRHTRGAHLVVRGWVRSRHGRFHGRRHLRGPERLWRT